LGYSFAPSDRGLHSLLDRWSVPELDVLAMKNESAIAPPPIIQIHSAESDPAAFGIFAHGQLQDAMGFDIISIEGWDGSLGIFPCHWEGQPCTLFVWASRPIVFHTGAEGVHYRGLVVLDYDEVAIAHATQCYNNKTQHP
jgi:hypothetical protein